MSSQLREYLLSYGYLASGSVELYGINSRQKMDSDMIRQTRYLHEYSPLHKALHGIIIKPNPYRIQSAAS